MTLPALTNQIASDIPNMAKLLTLKGTSVADASTSGTGEDNLASVTITASDLGATGVLKVFASGIMSGTTSSSKTVRFYWGTDYWPVIVSNVPGNWELEATIMLVSATSQRVTVRGRWGCYGMSPSYNKDVVFYDTSAQATASNVTVKCTGECLSASDTITQKCMYAQQIQLGS